ncbi:MAG: DUF1566 domain-containing protein [Chitinophagaceae bacterium]|nr:MAG: DUF1566 domain-containing protein [Chitinophagaceae bacterium]
MKKVTNLTALFILISLFRFSVHAETIICSGTTLTLEGINFINGDLQWQSSPDSIIWSDINGADQLTASVAPMNNIYYRLKITDPLCEPAEFYTNTKYVMVADAPDIPVLENTITWEDSIFWSWSIDSNVSSYFYSFVNNIDSAVNIGTDTSFLYSGLECDENYTVYLWAQNDCGFSDVLTLSASTESCPPFQCEIGKAGPAGGIVFYCDQNGGGLEVASSDWNDQANPNTPVDPNAPWGCSGVSIATGEAFGTGQSNTTMIVNACMEPNIAARWCNDYILIENGNVFNDWYLPSRDELTLIFNNIGGSTNQGGFRNVTYWSSSQRTANQAYGRNLITGAETTFGTAKTGMMGVRAIRAF